MVKTYLSLLRIAIGFIFLWAFLDKLLGLGFATVQERAWIAGASPTAGYLANATSGPFASIFQGIAGNPIIDFLFMFGLLGIGVAFVLGIALRLASISGVTLMALMYFSALPLANNPFIDEHIIYALVLLLLAESKAGDVMGFGKSWSRSSVVKSFLFLRN